jgi:hypothetical protein
MCVYSVSTQLTIVDVDLIFTFSIVFVGGRDVVEALFFATDDFARRTHFKRMAIRTTMVAVCALLGALLVDHFGILILQLLKCFVFAHYNLMSLF